MTQTDYELADLQIGDNEPVEAYVMPIEKYNADIQKARAEEREQIVDRIKRVAAEYDRLALRERRADHYEEAGYCDAYCRIVEKLAERISRVDEANAE